MRSLFATSILFCMPLLLFSGCEEAGNSEGSESESPPAPGIASEKPGERVSVDDGTFTRLSPIELRNIKKKENFLLVNVHIPLEGNVLVTDLSIPYNEIKQNLDQLPANKDSLA